MEGGFENRASERGSKRPETGLCWGQEKSNRIRILIVFLLLQGLRRAVEQEGVNIHFIKVKGHMDDHKGFIDKFRCAKGNKLADDYATKGMKEETTQMPYKMEGLPQYIPGETTTR